VVEQENPDRFPSYPWNQFPLDGFLDHQPNCPTGAAFRRITADHGNDPLPLPIVEQLLGSRPLFVVQRPL